MGLLDKIKGLLGKNKKTATKAVDTVADAAEKIAPDSMDDKIEAGAEKVKDVIEKLDGE
ncbi:MAG: Rv0909 family putative TA system antitoxin [Ilumatobacteraceae bacterium]|nr:antitoxin [Ilumatobacter sp.]MCB0981478.1 antitoxin [Ilumatobacter sp.]MCB0983375.1 antitoxin [Ilumatobacter sp.]MCB9380688.1 antitoxin [Acidimicrobiaceae bacterium]MCO5329192.1 Rv0909 family putative TA system antitoxin [Ilumatobacteraceae bacterium]